ncbi:MAG: 16S rRNA (cytosine(1402)-N(4))-methyltransferase RsmH [Planctomycetota bacterium]|nr:MAG: 16S rRNA (cytosine(1402)-N(4))-methyltransferase RsmH [Planctomycetota bacterium]
MSSPFGHLPVLLESVSNLLCPPAGGTVLDLTAGRGGHAEALARAAGTGGRILLCDLDAGNLAFSEARVRAIPGIEVRTIHGSFANADRAMLSAGWAADRVLADLGFASTQMDDPARGFSFQNDGALDMRLDLSRGETAADLLARMSESALADAIFQLGEDPFARRIARSIVERRSRAPFRTTHELAIAVSAAYGPKARDSRMHPATRTFMALRIMVNDELGALRGLLEALRVAASTIPGKSWLNPGARIGVISFHSLEDRLVKHAFVEWESAGLGRRLTRKPVEASDAELRANPRARSAKLRVFEFATEIIVPR